MTLAWFTADKALVAELRRIGQAMPGEEAGELLADGECLGDPSLVDHGRRQQGDDPTIDRYLKGTAVPSGVRRRS